MALITLLAGWQIILRPAGRDLTNLRQRVANHGSPSDRQALLVRTQTECTELDKSVTERRGAPGDDGIILDRNAAMQQISQLCTAHGLVLNAASIEASGKLPPALQEATTALKSGTNQQTPQVWRVEFNGAYAGAVKLLEGIQRSKPLIVPLSITMETARNERQPAKWALLLWL
jgi:hypothetical protein